MKLALRVTITIILSILLALNGISHASENQVEEVDTVEEKKPVEPPQEPIEPKPVVKKEPIQPKPIPVPPAPVVYSGSCEQYRDLIDNYDWDVNTALAICSCESTGNPNALNSTPPDYSVGLFQINLYGSLAASRPSEAWLRVPANNIDYAYGMWKNSGWSPWACIHKI